MKIFAATLLLTAYGLTQEIGELNRYADGSCGGVLTDDRGELPFHLAVTDYRTELWIGAPYFDREGARRAEPGGDEEQAAVARLLAWSRAAFDDDERAKIETVDDVHHRGSGWSFERYKEAAVVNRLAHYRRIRGAVIREVFRGRGTVRVSFKVRDGLGKEQLVLFRAVNDAWARPHLADSVEPVEIGSSTERWIVRAMHAYTEANIEERLLDLAWSGAAIGLADQPRDARDILFALVPYMNQTSPRFVNVFRLRDGGSVDLMFNDPRGRLFRVMFDNAIGSATVGRIRYGDGESGERRLIEIDSVEERQLLARLDHFVRLHEAEAAASRSHPAKLLAACLEKYREVREKKK